MTGVDAVGRQDARDGGLRVLGYHLRHIVGVVYPVPFFRATRGSRPSHLLKKVFTSRGSFCTVGAEPLWE